MSSRFLRRLAGTWWLSLALALAGLLGGCGRQGTVVWHVKPGAYLAASPQLFANVLYLATGGDAILALDPQTGRTLWQQRLIGGADTAPQVTEQFVIVNSNAGNLYLLDRRDGKIRWHFDTMEGGLVTPDLIGDSVVFLTRTHLRAVALGSGKLRWAVPLARPRLMAPVRGPTGLLYMATPFEILAIDSRTGRITRRLPVRGESVAPPAVWSNKLVNLAGRGTLQGFGLPGLRETWRLNLPGPAVLPMLVEDPVLYVPTGSVLVAIEAGVTSWTFQAPGPLRTAIVADAYSLYVATRGGGLLAIDKRRGLQRWQVPIPRDAFAVALAAAEGLVYLGWQAEPGSGGTMAIRGEDGRVLWRRTFAGGVKAAPAALEQTAFVATGSGEIVAVRP